MQQQKLVGGGGGGRSMVGGRRRQTPRLLRPWEAAGEMARMCQEQTCVQSLRAGQGDRWGWELDGSPPSPIPLLSEC